MSIKCNYSSQIAYDNSQIKNYIDNEYYIKYNKPMEKIQKLLTANASVYDMVKGLRLENMTERQLKSQIVKQYKKDLGHFVFGGDVVAGKNSALIEGGGSDNVINKGDAIILDINPYKDKQCADTTRTFFCGEPTKKQREIYAIVLNALDCGEKALLPGVKVSEIYKAVNDGLYPYKLVHHAGHLVGTRRVMQPQFLPDKDKVLKEGDIVALEPGIYVDGEFGIRIENNYQIVKNGFKKLFDYPLDIQNFIVK